MQVLSNVLENLPTDDLDFESDGRRLYKPKKSYWEPPEFNKKLLQLVWGHISSFNTFLHFYIKEIVNELDPIYIDPGYDPAKHELDPFYTPSEYLKISISDIHVDYPIRTDCDKSDRRMLPWYCRNSHTTYGAPLSITFMYNNVAKNLVKKRRLMVGTLPIMVRSDHCHLSSMSADEISWFAAEDVQEPGGYFIINGNERCIRYVIQQRTNHPIAIKKPRLADRDLFFTEFAVLLRSGRRDGTSTNNILFYTEDQQCAYRVLLNRQEWICPFWILLRALMPTIHLSLVKEKLLGNELLGAMGPEKTTKLEFLWQDFIAQEALFTDIDQYEDRYLCALGKVFWDGVSSRMQPGSRYSDAGRWVINKLVLCHCGSWADKFECIIHMYRKLLTVVHGEIPPENVDSFAYQEVITPGQLFAAVLKDTLFNTMFRMRLSYLNEIRVAHEAGDKAVNVIRSESLFDVMCHRVQGDISHRLNYFMATGNIRTFQLDLQQLSGWTVVSDRLNMHRFLSHFRAVHRGQFFAQMRTTEVRKLLGETWGFLCPVHTPDGSPCGLLLHMAQDATPVCDPPDGTFLAAVKAYMFTRGFHVDVANRYVSPPPNEPATFPLVVDGIPLTNLPRRDFDWWTENFRRLKMNRLHGFPEHIEIAAFKKNEGAFEGLYLFSAPARLVRPVLHLATGKVEWIGPLAQPWMSIACLASEVRAAEEQLKAHAEMTERYTNRPADMPPPTPADFTKFISEYQQEVVRRATQKAVDEKRRARGEIPVLPEEQEAGQPPPPGLIGNPFTSMMHNVQQQVPIKYSHMEMKPTTILSVTSALTPFSNHNQSPRNMYQCQMLKQTMGTPFHNIPYRTDNKSYRLLFPQKPVVRTADYRLYDFDDYSSGTNAVVAVIAYTGYDMEDAMIVNKSSMERGFANAVVYKQKIIDAWPASAPFSQAGNYSFSNRASKGHPIEDGLDTDGFAPIGTKLTKDAPMYRTVGTADLAADDRTKGHVSKYKDDEEAYVDKINIIAPPDARNERRLRTGVPGVRASMKLRCVRNPIVGDKFASRAGQKGICSMLMPSENMPFTGDGVVPDIVFNPHGFPSRMTVGMLLESMAGKASVLEGRFNDCTSFRDYPTRPKTGNRWIDQCGYHGWTRRGGRYRTPAEEAAHTRDTGADYFGKKLIEHGYQYYGTEPLMSGYFGVEMKAHIFIGVIYYQRLRHMVSDKWQVRSTGGVDGLTRQPIKGRKRGGGIRFGEMERDSILAHGASGLLQDRLLHCSDEHKAYVCLDCGSILSPSFTFFQGHVSSKRAVPRCRVCDVPCRLISLPYVFRYISNELAAMNICIRLQLKERDHPLERGGLKQQQEREIALKVEKELDDEMSESVTEGPLLVTESPQSAQSSGMLSTTSTNVKAEKNR